MRKYWLILAYQGSLGEALEKAHQCVLEVTEKLGDGFVVAPWRWVVERTLSWLEKARRLCRDYEVLPENHEGVVYRSDDSVNATALNR